MVFATKAAAQAELLRVLECERTSVVVDDRQIVAEYLTDWLAAKVRSLRPTTMVRYSDCVTKYLYRAKNWKWNLDQEVRCSP